MSARGRKENGFTLIELLVTITILGLIMFPLARFFIGYLRNTTSITPKLAESHDAQISAAYFAQDVAGLGTRATTDPASALAQSIETGVVGSVGLYPCGSASTTDVVRFASDDTPTAGTVNLAYRRVAYYVKTVSGQTQLHRITCKSGNAIPVTDAVLAHDLNPSTPPTVVCLNSAGSTVSCTGSGAAVPAQVRLTLTMRDPKSTTDLVVTLTGQRRTT